MWPLPKKNLMVCTLPTLDFNLHKAYDVEVLTQCIQ